MDGLVVWVLGSNEPMPGPSKAKFPQFVAKNNLKRYLPNLRKDIRILLRPHVLMSSPIEFRIESWDSGLL